MKVCMVCFDSGIGHLCRWRGRFTSTAFIPLRARRNAGRPGAAQGCCGPYFGGAGGVLQVEAEGVEDDGLGGGGAAVDMAKIKTWLEQMSGTTATQHAAEEALLNCAACHSTKDRHRGLFGTDCAQCHTTAKWTIAEFRHPSSASQSCGQCHQTTSWNDIKGVGFYKHH